MLGSNELASIFDALTGADISEKIDPLTKKTVSARSFAVSTLYREFSPIVFKRLRYQFPFGISENHLQDITQEAFLKIYTTNSLPKSFEALPQWVFKIALNDALDQLRKSHAVEEVLFSSWSDDEEKASGNPPVTNVSEDYLKRSNYRFISAGGVIKDFYNQVNRDVEKCMGEKMKLFSLKYPKQNFALSMIIDGKPTDQIAITLEKSVNATWVYIHESKKKLAPFIKDCLELLD